MKTIRFLLLPLVSSLFVSCDADRGGPNDGVIWDFMCYDVSIEVRDEQGNDLFDPKYERNILGNKIKVEYQGKTYVMGEETKTKYNMPSPLAAKAEYNDYAKKNFFCFGEFTPCDEFKNEKFTIDWGNGLRDEVEFDLYITWKRGDPTVHKRVSVNGVKVESEDPFQLKIVRDIGISRPIWDFMCYSVSFVVQDASGIDLLDATTPNNVLNGISVKYKDNVFTEIEPMSKEMPPLPLAIREGLNVSLNKKMITFGEFSPSDEHKGEKVEITWGDGSKDEVGFDLYTTWDKYYNPTVHKKYTLNGVDYTTAEPFVFRLSK